MTDAANDDDDDGDDDADDDDDEFMATMRMTPRKVIGNMAHTPPLCGLHCTITHGVIVPPHFLQ